MTIILADLDGECLKQAAEELHALALPSAPKVIIQQTDVSDLESVSALFEVLDKKDIILDVLVNNAGFMAPLEPIHQSDPFVQVKASDCLLTRACQGRLVENLGSQCSRCLSSKSSCPQA